MNSNCTLMKSALLLVLMLGVSCVRNPELKPGTTQSPSELQIPESFNHSTTQGLSINLSLKDNADKELTNVRVAVATADMPDKVIYTGATDANGVLSTTLSVPSYVENLVISTDYIGLPNQVLLPVNGSAISATLGGENPIEYATLVPASSARSNANSGRTQAITYSYLGTWNSQGVPNYRETQNDVVSSELLSWINASLPELKSVPVYHPDYIKSSTKTTLDVIAQADVWVTFVHEGAGWTNSLGYYTYPTGNPPVSVSDITNIKIVYPNVSYAGSGGGLQSGMKVNIGRFEPGTTIGFVLISQGWSGGTVGNGVYKLFSDTQFNPEATEALRFHNVLLYDEVHKLTVLGFEDTRRDNAGCDHDFNDAVFYVTSNPVTALKTSSLLVIDKPIDTDKDGINDGYDDFPTDPTRAFINDYPTKGTPGTLAFEDMWPATGDYDVNDLVVQYHHTTISNAQNKVIQLKTELIPKAVGATFRNGFGFEMPVVPSKVKSVSGYRLTENMIRLAANGLENGQAKSVIIAFDNAFSLYAPGTNGYTNVITGIEKSNPDTVRLTIDFATPLANSELGDMVFNPFLISNATRGREVHLAGYSNTSLANIYLFGTQQDNSNVSTGRYYKTSSNLPWAIHFPQVFDYPSEGKPLLTAYTNYALWAQSGGTQYKDWYLDKAGYRNTNNIYRKK